MPKTLYVSDADRALLAHYVLVGSQHPDIGFQDIDWSLNKMLRLLKGTGESIRNPHVSTHLVECALWYAKMLDELGAWEHPKQIKFLAWVKELTPKGLTYNDFWCIMEEYE